MPPAPHQAVILYELVLAALPDSAQPIMEEMMAAGTFEFKSQFARTYIAQGRAEGEARAILGVLDARGIHVPDDANARITACTDLDQLNIWVRRAATAATIDDLFH